MIWPFGKSESKPRRGEFRRVVAEKPGVYQRVRRRKGGRAALFIAVGFALIAGFLDGFPRDPLGYRQGQFVPTDITARENFRVLDPKRLADLAEADASAAAATFKLNAAMDSLLAELEKLPGRIQAAKDLGELPDDLTARLNLTSQRETYRKIKSLETQLGALRKKAPVPPSTQPASAPASQPATAPASQPTSAPADPAAVKAEKERRDKIAALEKQIAELQKSSSAALARSRKILDAWIAQTGSSKAAYAGALKHLRNVLAKTYIVRPDRFSEQQARQATQVHLNDGGSVLIESVSELQDQSRPEKLVAASDKAIAYFESPLKPAIQRILIDHLKVNPVYLYEAETSQAAIDAARQDVLANPPDSCYTHYPEGQILVKHSNSVLGQSKPGGQSGLTADNLALLEEEQKAFLADEQEHHPFRSLMRLVGHILVALLLTGVLCVYIALYNPQLVEQTAQLLRLAVMMIVMLVLLKVLWLAPWLNNYVALLPTCIVALILTLAYDRRFALAVGAIFAALAVAQINGNFNLLIVLMGGMMMCIFPLREIRSRGRLMMVVFVASLCVFALIIILAMRDGRPWPYALRAGLWGFMFVLLAGILVQALMPLIERVFAFATGSTLLEWCDAAKPLLRRLAMEAPGTYNHSLQLGAMCESAAEAIGARGLLARVGAYYHDIGKIVKPEYFVENQSGGKNKHDGLSPAMSLLIILGHVKDGQEMARQYNLPEVLREFISSHHGTTLVQYFYHAAKERSQAAGGKDMPDESQFRYPGPKPHSPEAAILMLADGAESSVRAMPDPTPSRISTQVHKIVTARLEDGQLDECDLTLRQVHAIEESLVKSLCGMYHSRLAYPDEKDREKIAEKPLKKSDDKPDSPAAEKA